MLIIGEMNITYKRGVGDFYCPGCKRQQMYQQKRVRRFLTLYFIPVIPLDLIGEHVQCQSCRQQFTVDSLNFREEDYRREEMRQFANDVKRVMVLTMIADDIVDEDEIATVQQVYRRLTAEEISREQIEREVELARSSGASAARYAQIIAHRRSEEEKDWIVRGAFLVASAGGGISPERLEQLKLLPQALGMSEERFRQIIEQSA